MKNISITPIDLTENDSTFSIGKIDLNSKELLSKAFAQAVLKSQHTNNANQNNQLRNPYVKFEKQLQGIISEIIVEEYLRLIFQDTENINRYDDVRIDNFKSPNNEYDAKIKLGNDEYDVEIRSSLSYRRSMDFNNLKSFDVIGPYKNQMKKHEAYNDFYIRPILQLKNPNSNLNVSDINIAEGLLNDKFDFYITGGCSRDMMVNKSKDKTMGQKNTVFRVVPVLESLDIKGLTDSLRQLRKTYLYKKNRNRKTRIN